MFLKFTIKAQIQKGISYSLTNTRKRMKESYRYENVFAFAKRHSGFHYSVVHNIRLNRIMRGFNTNVLTFQTNMTENNTVFLNNILIHLSLTAIISN